MLRFICMLMLAVWVGGFMFYGGAVVPILHDELEGLRAGEITRRVTDVLNAVGLATLAAWSLAAWFERTAGPPLLRWARLRLLATTWLILGFLIILHRIMDERLDAESLSAFYPLHRLYLTASTVQWLVNLGLLAVWLIHWGPSATGPLDPPRRDDDRETREPPDVRSTGPESRP